MVCGGTEMWELFGLQKVLSAEAGGTSSYNHDEQLGRQPKTDQQSHSVHARSQSWSSRHP
jgi:hypothetical protein